MLKQRLVAVAKPIIQLPLVCRIGFAALTCSLLLVPLTHGPLLAQALPDPFANQPTFATVSLGLGKIVSPRRHKVTFEKVGVQPQQVIDVTLQYPVGLAGRPLAVEPLDGGQVLTTSQDLKIAAKGSATLQFKAGTSPGLYQVRVHYDAQAIALQFWVIDAAHLYNTPPVLTAP
jgi:hypothetical protein